ncbi:tripartite tricarboxylate transporter TctB family protein [Mesorhizobium sp. BE184]|uniref:tripartite tricarboxylate transporter TctB family protein n=1 Tax=Mesorhizobium sp. BE184 TaxID=2817714 RepID=UPI002863722C|nr:tripartite tricarboxylate transporter TctB family protein [Mesorhizobium sp. BE184]MDR7034454.1 putative tricarboxylic transport membrane protein [Mesorhizobium sp. BE184]
MSISEEDGAHPRVAMPELLLGIGFLACAGAVLWQTLAIPVSPLYSKVGPKVFPYITFGGMLVLALLLILSAVRGGWQQEEEKETPTDWRSMSFVVAGLVANLVLIQPLGFTAASVVMFTLVCYGFGSRRPIRDALLGLVLALAAYFGFAKALGVNIGAGIIENQLNAAIAALTGTIGG